MESQPQNPEFRNNPENILPCIFCIIFRDFLWKVCLKILNSGIILKMFSHVYSVLFLENVCPFLYWQQYVAYHEGLHYLLILMHLLL